MGSKVKIFVGYYQPEKIYASEVFQPIWTSKEPCEIEGVLQDNTGDNISQKNEYYAELSGHYWVWKNFLKNTDAEYIGFCHYRRFFTFDLMNVPNFPFYPIYKGIFPQIFEKYSQENILQYIDDADIILPLKFPIKKVKTVYEQFVKYHPQKDIDTALDIIDKIYPQYNGAKFEVMLSDKMYTCLNFIMKKELVEQYFEWIFNILFELERVSDWAEYKDYNSIRTPAYLAERFFNIWLEYNIAVQNLKVKNSPSVLLFDKEQMKSLEELLEKACKPQ